MNQTSPLDAHRAEVLDLVWSRSSYAEIIAALKRKGVKTSERSIRRALRRWEEPTPGGTDAPRPERESVRIENDQAHYVTEPSEELGTPEDLMVKVGLSPEDWEIKHVKVNKWRGMTGKKRDNELVWMYQLVIQCVRKKPYEFLLPAQDGPTYRAPRLPVYKWDNARLVAFMGDQQAPYQDDRLHEKACRWIERNQPDQLVLIGDGMDFPDISRHPENPEWHVEAQGSINSCYRLYRDYRQANEQMVIDKLLGNHDERIRIRLLQYLTRLYEIRPGWIEGEEDEPLRVWDTRNILRLDELNINLVDPNGAYAHAQVQLSPHLAARHGWIAKKGSGATALATLDALGYSIVVGHTHRQAIVHKTTHDINGTPSTLVAVETGCMCRIEGGLGYAVAPDWQNGYATAVINGDGTFHPELATYVGGNLYWRDQRF